MTTRDEQLKRRSQEVEDCEAVRRKSASRLSSGLAVSASALALALRVLPLALPAPLALVALALATVRVGRGVPVGAATPSCVSGRWASAYEVPGCRRTMAGP